VAALLDNRLARLGVATELVIDKLPSTPSRLRPGGMAARLAAAAIAGGVIGRSVPAVLVATGAAALSARVGHDLRAEASKHAPPFAVAVAEDLVALGLARFAAC
jgi:uncharacterized membrane protein